MHFLILGGVLFGLHRYVAPPVVNNRIVLSDAVIRGLRQEHLRRNGALPTTEEEQALIQRFVDDEVLYREALTQGLDRGDIIVRRRLVQKMEFALEGLDPVPEPTDAELAAYLEGHAQRYAAPDRITFAHVFVSADRHPADAQAIAARVREQLLHGAAAATLGDPFLRGNEFVLQSERQVAAAFGPRFAARAMSLPVETWSEPLRSSYGWHVVRVTERRPADRPRLDDVREPVRRDWEEERRAEINRAALQRLRQHYEIRVETPHAGIEAQQVHSNGHSQGHG